MKTLALFIGADTFHFDIISTAPLTGKSSHVVTIKQMTAWLERLHSAESKKHLDLQKTAAQLLDTDSKAVKDLTSIYLRNIEEAEDGYLFSFAYDQAQTANVVHLTKAHFFHLIDRAALHFAGIGFVAGLLVGAVAGALGVYSFIHWIL